MLTLLSFIIAISILVTIHEFGHYWVAKKCGIKILKFSVGFGQTLWSRRYGADQTEFIIAAIPLGGYVQMLDEQEGQIAPEEQHRAFNRQSLAVRSAVVLAGPLANFLFAIAAYSLIYMIGVSGLKPIIGEVTPNSPAAQAGLQAEQQIIAVEGQAVSLWQEVIEDTLPHILSQEVVHYTVQHPRGYEQEIELDLRHLSLDNLGRGQFFDKVGMFPIRPHAPAVINKVMDNSAAARDGLQAGDKVLAIDGQQIDDWYQFVQKITKNPEHKLTLTIERAGKTLNVITTPKNEAGQGKLGIAMQAPPPLPEQYFTVKSYGFFQAVWASMQKTWDLSFMTIEVMGKMLTLQLSTEHISGPISIAQFAGQSAESGVVPYLLFLALVSLSLGVINLFPLPPLDGGHLMLYSIELLKGSPASAETQLWLQKVGFVFVISLMGLAIFNDLDRLFS